MKKQQSARKTAHSQPKSARKTTAARTRPSRGRVAAAKTRVGTAAKKVVKAVKGAVVKVVKGAKAPHATPRATVALTRRKLTVKSPVASGEVLTAAPGHDLMARLITLVNDRFERRSKEYDHARKEFEAAAEAVRSADSDDKSIKLRTNLNHFGTEMRVQAARRAELDWLRRVLQGEGS